MSNECDLFDAKKTEIFGVAWKKQLWSLLHSVAIELNPNVNLYLKF